ncbi:vesicle-associated membrane protein 2-like [Hyposmocoma kahamanoa]|uniref:vesicle-associated membrane protein 2-like n=1 Tax=Hyposmocoma kahamanoa TaxID=1477025 RepID=UPI000E6D5F95|nr:vesicle-associated membrane protein 2-like [Hyposmocoma kahamanoa]
MARRVGAVRERAYSSCTRAARRGNDALAEEGEKAAPSTSTPAEVGAPVGEPGSSLDAPTGDGEIVGGPRNMQQIAAQRRLQQTQAQVQEVVDIMKVNMEKVIERDTKLSDLSERAEALQDDASMFEKQAKSLKNKFWLENLKSMIISGIILLIIIGVIYEVYL